ncbi:MAG: hypothetical protein ACREQ9_11825 [Candidatus Binatia bacterium]
MRRHARIVVALAVMLMPAGAWSHDSGTGDGTYVFEPWRPQFVPYFDDGDPKTRHDSDQTNDEGRDDAETRRSSERWRDEIRTDGSQGDVGVGCMETFCTSASVDGNDVLRVDHSITIGPSTRQNDRNAVAVEALGAGGTLNLGGAEKMDAIAIPRIQEAGPEGDPDTEPDVPSDPAPPERVSVQNSGDHTLLGAAHSNTGHDPYPAQGNHDAHGGTIYADVYVPTADDPTAVQDSRAGIVILDHLGCTFGCSDEFHRFYAADPERTLLQIGEMPGQTEDTARNPDDWIYGYEPYRGPLPTVPLGGSTAPVTDALFAADGWAAIGEASASATGAGAANSACCAPRASDGQFCNRNPGGAVNDALDGGGIAGCLELSNGDCVGGVLTPDGFEGCMVSGGQATVDGAPASNTECSEAAADACCSAGACR